MADASEWLPAGGKALDNSVGGAPQGNISAASMSGRFPSGPLGGSIHEVLLQTRQSVSTGEKKVVIVIAMTS